MKIVILISILTIGFYLNGVAQQDKDTVDVFMLSEAYCNGNPNYKAGDNIRKNFPENTYLMWITKNDSSIFYGVVPDSLDTNNDKMFAFANVRFQNCNSLKQKVEFDKLAPKHCAQGKIYSPFFEGENAQFLVFEKLPRINPKDPYQYVCLTFYYKLVNGTWEILQLYGKTMELKHKIQ